MPLALAPIVGTWVVAVVLLWVLVRWVERAGAGDGAAFAALVVALAVGCSGSIAAVVV